MGALKPRWVGRLSVRVRLVLLLILVTIPVVVAAISNAVNRREADLAAGRRVVAMLADAVLREQATVLAATQQLLTALAPQVASASSPACDRSLIEKIVSTGKYFGGFFLLDQIGHLKCSTGRSGGGFSPSALFESVKTTGGFSVALTTVEFPESRGALLAGLPIAGNDGIVATVGATMPVAAFASMPGYGRMPEGSAVWILPRGGDRAVNIVGGDELLPQPVAGGLSTARTDSVFESGTQSGEQVFYAVRPLTDSLLLMAALPASPTISHADADFAFRLTQIVLLLGLSVLVVTFGAHYSVLKPLRMLGNAFRSYGGSEVPFTPPPGLPAMPAELRRLARRFVEVTETVTDREVKLKELLTQRDQLVHEIHHRVKNNLQIVSSMLSLQAHRIRHPVARSAIHVARERIVALMLLHQHMYRRQEVRAIEIQSFLNELVTQLAGMADDEDRDLVSIDIIAPPMELSTDQAGPLGLMIAEIVINCLNPEPAAAHGCSLRIELLLHPEGRGELLIRSETRPLLSDSDGLSQTLVRGFVQQLGGKLELARRPADFCLKVVFPIPTGGVD
ncbi:MAG: sensor histidine kinase [Alphaproteobacteria bacterium]|nr:sensor histidine kinase [Alphaproteobacteria bacterium]